MPFTALHSLGLLGNETSAKVTAATTATVDRAVYICDTTGAAFTVTLPALADAHTSGTGRGVCLFFRNVTAGANNLTLDGNGSETVNGGANITLGAGVTACLWAGPDGWYSVA